MSERKPETEYTDAELVQIAKDNHIWVNAYACISPTDEVKKQVGEAIIKLLNHTEMTDEFGIGWVVYVRINKS